MLPEVTREGCGLLLGYFVGDQIICDCSISIKFASDFLLSICHYTILIFPKYAFSNCRKWFYLFLFSIAPVFNQTFFRGEPSESCTHEHFFLNFCLTILGTFCSHYYNSPSCGSADFKLLNSFAFTVFFNDAVIKNST